MCSFLHIMPKTNMESVSFKYIFHGAVEETAELAIVMQLSCFRSRPQSFSLIGAVS